MRKPFYRKSRKCWFVVGDDGKHVRLDKDEDKAFDIWRGMLDRKSSITSSVSFRRLADEWVETNYEDSANFQAIMRRIALFVDHLGLKQAMSVTKRDVIEWLNKPKRGRRKRDNAKGEPQFGKDIVWGAKSKADALSAITKVYSWAIQRGHLAFNPIAGIKLEAPEPRVAIVTKADHVKIMAAVDPAFRCYIIASTCGVRPKQIREVTAANVLPDFTAWVFRRHKTSGKTGKPLVVYLPPCLQTLTRVLVARHPSGPLFRNMDGNPWKKDTVVQKVDRLRAKLDLPKDFTVYAYRHTFATNALLNEVPLQTVSELLGHSDTRMVSKVYGHLDQHRNYLSEAVIRATKK
jgi:integrase